MLDHPNEGPDDESFETYLKRFRPLVPDALHGNEVEPAPHRSFGLNRLGGWVVAMLILGAVGLRILDHRRSGDSDHTAAVNNLRVSAPLTMRRADNLLATAPSYKAVMNELTLPTKSSPVPNGEQSALGVLSKEKIKL